MFGALFQICHGFEHCCVYFTVKPKQADSAVHPKDFFTLWVGFCTDFKDLWKREQQRVIKERSVRL